MELTIKSDSKDHKEITEVFMNTLNIPWMVARLYYQMIQDKEVTLTNTGWESFSNNSLVECFKGLSAIGCKCKLSTKDGVSSSILITHKKNREINPYIEMNNKISSTGIPTEPVITAEQKGLPLGTYDTILGEAPMSLLEYCKILMPIIFGKELDTDHKLNERLEKFWLKDAQTANIAALQYRIDYTLQPGDFEHGEIWEKRDKTLVIYNQECQRWFCLPMDRD